MTVSVDLEQRIGRLQGPILVLGGSGFIGANLLRMLLGQRADVYGTALHLPAWRLEGLPGKNVVAVDLLVDASLDSLLDKVKPRTVFNCVAYGAYSFETDSELIFDTNFNLTARLLKRLEPRKISCYVHSGSSSEYGDHAAGPRETDLPQPNSDYAVSKVACANLLYYYGKKKHFPCANLRLYSAYGPFEDASRLIPNVVKCGIEGHYPSFVSPDISRDFVYIDDVCEAYIDTALNLKEPDYGDSFNVGSAHKTTIGDVAQVAAKVFGITGAPDYNSMPARAWDISDWYSDQKKTSEVIGWRAHTDFATGLSLAAEWYDRLEDKEKYENASKRFGLDAQHSISAIIACYKDGQAIPIMYDRLKKTFDALKIEHEIIFVNDNSPDNSEEVIQGLSRRDRRVVGISHSRNFGSQAAFRSGMEIASKKACVLLDGDLQDPPELIEQFVEQWKQGYDVVYGRRVQRQASLFMRIAYKLFYRLFDKLSYLSIPRDAGDFSLMDRKVVKSLLRFPERDLFLRGLRAFVGYKQVGVDYVRPERMFGRTTNSFFKNLGWAKKGVLSFSYVPLTALSIAGTLLFLAAIGLGGLQVILRLLFPASAPRGATTILLTILFFGSVNLLGLAVVGEYLAKIFEEVKRRPHFIRRSIIKHGDLRAMTGARHENASGQPEDDAL